MEKIIQETKMQKIYNSLGGIANQIMLPRILVKYTKSFELAYILYFFISREIMHEEINKYYKERKMKHYKSGVIFHCEGYVPDEEIDGYIDRLVGMELINIDEDDMIELLVDNLHAGLFPEK